MAQRRAGCALLAQYLLERAFVKTLATGQNVKPWPWADTWPVARVEVPRLGERAIVLHRSSGQALAFGPGQVERTPEPGEPGTAVYVAHRDTHFNFLRRVRIGDLVKVTRRDGASFWFRVRRASIVQWDASGIDPFAPGRTSCWQRAGHSTRARPGHCVIWWKRRLWIELRAVLVRSKRSARNLRNQG